MKLVGTGILETLSTRNDGTIKIVLGTQEMGSDDAGRLFMFRNKYLKWLISDDNITPLEEELVAADKISGSKKKSQAQRLRAVLFRMHEQSGLQIDFEQYYNTETERIIEHYKSKLQ